MRQAFYKVMVKPAFIFDGRNILDHNELMAFGFEVCDFATLKSRFAANVDDVSSCSHIYLFSVFQLDRFLFSTKSSLHHHLLDLIIRCYS